MQLARVIGDVVATRKDENLVAIKLLVVQPIGADGRDVGRPLVATDSVGAGVGENVFFVRGREAAFPFYPIEPPTDAAIVGIVDEWSCEGPQSGAKRPKRIADETVKDPKQAAPPLADDASRGPKRAAPPLADESGKGPKRAAPPLADQSGKGPKQAAPPLADESGKGPKQAAREDE